MTEASDRSLQILNMALEKEEKGRQFYKQASETCASELGKQMFRSLMADEGVHITRIKDIFQALQGGKSWSSEWKKLNIENEDLRKLLQERMTKLGPKVKADSGDVDAVRIGLEMEQGAINFYEDQLTKATDALETDFFQKMVAEERTHFAALNDVKMFLENPELWFAEKERSTLDGA
jgi:rubrerythrin